MLASRSASILTGSLLWDGNHVFAALDLGLVGFGVVPSNALVWLSANPHHYQNIIYKCCRSLWSKFWYLYQDLLLKRDFDFLKPVYRISCLVYLSALALIYLYDSKIYDMSCHIAINDLQSLRES